MNFLWGGLILISLVFSTINGNIQETITAGFDGASSGITVVLSFAGIMCLWTGLLGAAEKSGLCRMIKKMIYPLLSLIFPKLDRQSDAMNYITLNVTANLIGMGNGATPMGIKAMGELSKTCGDKPSEEMCMFTVLNTTALQLIPSTIIALMSANGSKNPFIIVVPIWICSIFALIAAVTSVKIMFAFIKRSELSKTTLNVETNSEVA